MASARKKGFCSVKHTRKKKVVRSRNTHQKRTILIATLIILVIIALVVLLQNKNILYGRAGTTVIPVTACGSLDIEGGVYEFQNDISNSVINSNCITINAKNIQLDGKGFKIYGSTDSQGFGIYIGPGWEGSTIQNVLIEKHLYCMVIHGTQKITMSDVTVVSSGGSALYILKSNTVILSNNNLTSVSAYSTYIQ